MKKILLTIVTVFPLLHAEFTYGQTVETRVPATLGLDFTMSHYPYRQGAFFSPKNTYPGVALTYLHPISGCLFWSDMCTFSFVDSIQKGKGFTDKKLLVENNVNAVWLLASPNQGIQPFVTSGIGGAYLYSKLCTYLPVGGGLRAKVAKDVHATIQVQYRTPLFSALHAHFLVSFGISGSLSGHSRHPHPSKAMVIASTMPHSSRAINDRDHDGIADPNDQCPDIPGFIQFAGCPGPSAANVSLTKSSQGSAAEVEELLNSESYSIHFSVNSHLLLPESTPSLRRIATILRLHPCVVEIDGHTDSVGSSQNNLLLSQRRAESVMTYLTTAGIAASRMSAKGFGESIPIQTNTSDRGRAENRRVVFKVLTNKSLED